MKYNRLFQLFKPLSLLDEKYIWIPYGEDYGGFTDRHIILNQNDIRQALNLMERIILDTNKLYDEMKDYDRWNIEQYIKYHLAKSGMLHRVRRFPRSMFTVRGEHNGTRWSEGHYDENLKCYVKYKYKYDDVMANSNFILNTRSDWTDIMTNIVNNAELENMNIT